MYYSFLVLEYRRNSAHAPYQSADLLVDHTSSHLTLAKDSAQRDAPLPRSVIQALLGRVEFDSVVF